MDYYEHGGNKRKVLDFSININPLGMPNSVKNAIINHIPDYSAYPDTNCSELKAALSEVFQLPAKHFLCGNGVSDLIFRICAALKPARVFTLVPTFSEYERCVRLFGGTVVHDSVIKDTLDENSFDMAFICNPNNPTGLLTSLERIEKLLLMDKVIVVDESFIEFTSAESAVSLLRFYPKLIVLRAFTKIYGMAGLRLGYLLSDNPRLLKKIARHGAQWSVSSVAQAAGLAALTETDWIERTRALVTEERKYMIKHLSLLGLGVLDGTANFLLIKSDEHLHRPLLRRGIHVRACENFPRLDKSYIRIGLKTRPDNDILLVKLKEVLDDD